MNAADAVAIGPGVELCEGRYRLERVLGVGGMASVWLGRDQRLDRPVAIKVLSDSLSSDQGYVLRFRREAQIAARLLHPNLVKVFDFEPEGRPALIMEYVEGGTLADEANHPRSAAEVEALATQLLGALEHIHAAGIVHRDVKPSNVLIGDDGRPLLTDFGIAQPEDATRLTQTGQVIGTLAYMAPELQAGERATPQSDLYSAGVVLRDHLGDDAPRALRRLVDRLTEREPQLRPASAKQALAYLTGSGSAAAHRAQATQPIAIPVDEKPEEREEREEEPAIPLPPPRSPASEPRREYVVKGSHVLAGLALLAAVIAVIAILSGGGSDDAPPAGDEPAAAEKGSGAAAGDSSSPSASIPPPSEKPDPAKGAELNDEGHALIGSGDYDKAVKVLEKALADFPADARTPEAVANDPNYAYALFNYGQALRLAGRPDEAIPVLEERLALPNQPEVVQAELDLAEAEAAE